MLALIVRLWSVCPTMGSFLPFDLSDGHFPGDAQHPMHIGNREPAQAGSGPFVATEECNRSRNQQANLSAAGLHVSRLEIGTHWVYYKYKHTIHNTSSQDSSPMKNTIPSFMFRYAIQVNQTKPSHNFRSGTTRLTSIPSSITATGPTFPATATFFASAF